MSAPRPHDLLWSDGAAADPASPPWASAAWLALAPLVVRRAPRSATRLPVGLRGSLRHERHACHIDAALVRRRVTPETLAALPVAAGQCAALDLLKLLAPRLNDTGWAWGPTGGAGFALASGLPVLRADSDLDLVLRIVAEPDAVQTAALRAIAALATGCRLDLQIDTGHGGFAYAEWAAGRAGVLLKTDHGPLLTSTPWEPR
jgi:phosphoribosyl-dephospho-CoA transferase